MKFIPIALTAALAMAGAAQAAKPAANKATGVRLSAALSGANEVGANGQTGVGDPNGTGTFTARLNPGQKRLCYTLTYRNIDAPSAGHIHVGAAGVNGGVFIPLPSVTAGTERCFTVAETVKVQALLGKPGDYYVNLHNTAFPNGAIRGQVAKN